ncbi:Cof-type HAD-IIB family hydrolase [Ruminiclostridium hungatei]|uniref:Cof-type HAD-IIB family hydrolase n=1 Tax=Ruminiclostridium hungatei TaxID=48256 RepID=UPI0009AD41CC|nr:Cof-type HAD-IIB family hydrolase [Ruminiclostridium hungatei]
MYKLVAIDLDGTLLNMDKEISDRNKEAIFLAMQKGVKVVICSGRVYTGARLYAKQIGSRDPIIACNGAIITERLDGDIIYSDYMDLEVSLKVNHICKQQGVYFHVYAGDTMLTEKLGFTSKKYFEKNKFLPPEDRVDIEVVGDMQEKLKSIPGKVLKFVIVSDDPRQLRKTRMEMEKLEEVDIMSSNFDNFEVMNKGVSKGAALEKLSLIYEIPPEQMIAIGDNENDVSMFEYAGLGIAMDNGEAVAKAAAKYITAGNDDDGVAQAIEKFVLAKG